MTKLVSVTSVKEYFNLPREQREKWGFWYIKPYALPSELFSLEEGWESWEKQIKKLYPIQYRIRELLSKISYCFYGNFGLAQTIRYKLSCFFFPRHQDIRKAVPREWQDLTVLIVDLNFAIIKSFYKEAKEGYIDWESDEEHKNFMKWLESSYHYITVERIVLEEQLSNSYPTREQRLSLSYEEAYKEVDRLEKLTEEKDKQIIKEMIDHKDYFWV